MRVFLESLTKEGKLTLSVGSTPTWSGVLDWIKGQSDLLLDCRHSVSSCHVPAALPAFLL